MQTEQYEFYDLSTEKIKEISDKLQKVLDDESAHLKAEIKAHAVLAKDANGNPVELWNNQATLVLMGKKKIETSNEDSKETE